MSIKPTQPVNSSHGASEALAQVMISGGRVLIVEGGLIRSTEAAAIAPLMTAPLSAAAHAGLRELKTIAAQPWYDPWQEPDSPILPGPFSLLEAALHTLGWLPGTQTPAPWAAWAAMAEGLDLGDTVHAWMQLMPCRLSLSAQAVGLVPLPEHAFTNEQVLTLEKILRGWPAEILRSQSGSVFIRSESPFDVFGSSPHLLTGLHLAHFLPTGPRSAEWRRLSTEIEMAFFALDTTDENQAQTAWPWGAGQRPSPEKPYAPQALNALHKPSVGSTTDQASMPMAIAGMKHWLAQMGYFPELRWLRADTSADWPKAWSTAFEALDQAYQAGQPCALIASYGWHARLWSSHNISGQSWQSSIAKFLSRYGARLTFSSETYRSLWREVACLSDDPSQHDV